MSVWRELQRLILLFFFSYFTSFTWVTLVRFAFVSGMFCELHTCRIQISTLSLVATWMRSVGMRFAMGYHVGRGGSHETPNLATVDMCFLIFSALYTPVFIHKGCRILCPMQFCKNLYW
ncbi:hypothetical protein VNO77_41226 [Canavalia gladiata]|uniref:Uncharacterized protein n=1 Tax=Canavalia gladiata TaxID=3824 RepID=A0AAN9K1G4_CANGL